MSIEIEKLKRNFRGEELQFFPKYKQLDYLIPDIHFLQKALQKSPDVEYFKELIDLYEQLEEKLKEFNLILQSNLLIMKNAQ